MRIPLKTDRHQQVAVANAIHSRFAAQAIDVIQNGSVGLFATIKSVLLVQFVIDGVKAVWS